MTDECDPEYHRIDTFRILRRGRGLSDAELANRMAIFTASECAEVAKEYQSRIEELEGLQIDLSYQTEETHACYDKVKKLQARLEELEAENARFKKAWDRIDNDRLTTARQSMVLIARVIHSGALPDQPERLEAAVKEWANLLKELKGTDDEG